MGNRAVVKFEEVQGVGVYLHWNGGRDSIEAFCEYCKRREFRDDDYGVARFIQVVANFVGGALSIGVAPPEALDEDNWDNGSYTISLMDWKIKKREFFKGEEQKEYDLEEMVREIDRRQPENDRLYKEEG